MSLFAQLFGLRKGSGKRLSLHAPGRRQQRLTVSSRSMIESKEAGVPPVWGQCTGRKAGHRRGTRVCGLRRPRWRPRPFRGPPAERPFAPGFPLTTPANILPIPGELQQGDYCNRS
jgi:hypothetical protein